MTVAQQVENLLKYVPSTRGSDRELWITYAQKFGVQLTEAQVDKIRQMPSLETLTRVRRKIQEEGRYPAPPKIARERRMKSYEMQQNMPSSNAKRTSDILTNLKQMEWI